jgi:OmcA/MtrC family decaheme c-type cytochrome
MARIRKSLFTAPVLILILLAIPVVAELATDVAQDAGFTKHDAAYYLDENLVSFVRPGVAVKIVSAGVAQDGTITARFTVTDPKGVPLDKDGVQTPGTVSLSFIAAYIPAGQTQYRAYTTTTLAATLNSNPTQTQAGTDSGGTYTKNADGDYTYTFKTKAPAGFDATATHTIGITARRDLSEFITQDEWAQCSNSVYNFVPNGSAVKVTRAVVSTQACNQCHDPLFGHGGTRLLVEVCILCHQPQTINPDTLLSQDMPVLIHKIHMGKNLPSVLAGTPYRIWHRGAWSDFSDVGFPSGTDELKQCQVCHQGAPQAGNYLTNPTRAACGACHDDVNFATGLNHVNLPEPDDKQCAGCHIPQGELEFDASIKGAHTVTTQSAQLPGVVFSILKVDNTLPGSKPTVTFTVKDKSGKVVDISKMNSLSLVLAGPNTDYTTYVSENARGATASGSQYVYTFSTPLPNNATASFAVGIEGYNNVTINPNTVRVTTVRDAGFNQVFYFAIDGNKMTPRRQVVSQKNCTTCHAQLMLHGGSRQNVEYCLICHNPNNSDSSRRTSAQLPAESINFKTMIHKIHTGSNLETDFTIMGFNSSTNNFNDVGYPGDRRDCIKCHVNNSEELPLPSTNINQTAPRDWINPLQPITGACLSCHTAKATAAHAATMTDARLGEACAACHGQNNDASIDKVHAR